MTSRHRYKMLDMAISQNANAVTWGYMYMSSTHTHPHTQKHTFDTWNIFVYYAVIHIWKNLVKYFI